ncbi:hypothetical protein BJV82DRAFT_614701 [Fennellomyces sp. T-0311]|nr:hypothetical protein BJV82DRAFT_614701 [Fennellomyces sp. T-0311]
MIMQIRRDFDAATSFRWKLLLFGMYVSGQELVKFGLVWFCRWIRLCVWIRRVRCLELGVTLDLTWTFVSCLVVGFGLDIGLDLA